MPIQAFKHRRIEGGFRITLRMSDDGQTIWRQIYKDYDFLDEEAVNMKAGAVAAKVAYSPDPDMYFDYLCSMGWSPYLPE